tara:strand:- start:44 stop:454 length:411 start_codon:yes stop_codon:yes gene_type:complete
MDRDLTDLRKIETIIGLYEYITNNGCNIIIKDNKMFHKISDETPQDMREQILTMIKANKDNFISLVGNLDDVRTVLQTVQKRMILGQQYISSNFDLWDRLEKVYRKQDPEITSCINPDKCPEESLIHCKSCEGNHA